MLQHNYLIKQSKKMLPWKLYNLSTKTSDEQINWKFDNKNNFLRNVLIGWVETRKEQQQKKPPYFQHENKLILNRYSWNIFNFRINSSTLKKKKPLQNTCSEFKSTLLELTQEFTEIIYPLTFCSISHRFSPFMKFLL